MDINTFVNQVNLCVNQEQLDAVKEAWSKLGCLYHESEWPKVWSAMADKKLEFDRITEPAF